MLRSTKELRGYALEASDGSMGRTKDLLFDDEKWVVRYLVADTGRWLPDRKILLSPANLGRPDSASKGIQVKLTKDQIEDAPPLEAHKPLSKQHEALLHRHFEIPYYWLGKSLWGLARTPYELKKESAFAAELKPEEMEGDPHLRSVEEITGYHIQASDGEVGHVEGFILEDEDWTLPYLVVDTRDWLPGRKVLISHRWVQDLDWVEAAARVDLSREQIEKSPEYDPSGPLDREYEERLHEHYRRPTYWH